MFSGRSGAARLSILVVVSLIVLKVVVGIITGSLSVLAQAMASTAPAAPMRWPTMDLVELTGILPACGSKTVWIAIVSVRSFRAVLVPWALM